ncbi:NTF2- export protein 2 [Tritrichomonas musculus]|uniref:Nuclear transport factor 2 n=1 Tax=Tritrichomonas musculus TaxID=1915356 RepID=A0ABR2JEB7_9EUKA
MSDPLSPESLGIGQTIVLNYFPLFMKSPNEVLQFYGNNSVLTWNGTNLNGIDEIRNFFGQLQNISFQVSGFEVQTVPNTSLWTMLVVFGTSEAPGNIIRDFHSTFYIQSDPNVKKGIIRYHTFQNV